MQTLISLNLSQNILRKHVSNKEFISDLVIILQTCYHLVHLDLSGMNLTRDQAKVVLNEGVYRCSKLACAHIGYQGGNLPVGLPVPIPDLVVAETPEVLYEAEGDFEYQKEQSIFESPLTSSQVD